MAGDGRSTDDVTLPLLFLFHKEGNILLEALKEYREVEVLLSDKARDRGVTLLTRIPSYLFSTLDHSNDTCVPRLNKPSYVFGSIRLHLRTGSTV